MSESSDTSQSSATESQENQEEMMANNLDDNTENDANTEDAVDDGLPKGPIVIENIYEAEETYKEQEFIYNEDDPKLKELEKIEGEPLSRGKIIMDVVKQLRTGKDLYRISLPSALLAPVSMLEYISTFLVPHPFIVSVAKKMDPEQRFTSVLKWWISNLVHTPRLGIMHCKPYNAIHGEVFAAKWIHEDSKSFYLAEQVSHHPPISAVYFANPQRQISLIGTLKPKSKFHGNSASNVIDGEIVFRINNVDEEYRIEFPYVVGKGLLWGTQCIEVNEHLKITCDKTKFSANVEFKSKNIVKGSIKKDAKRLYKLHGNLQEKIMIKNSTNKKETEFLNAAELPKVPKYVRPVAKQQENESRRVWHRVTNSIKHKRFDEANVRKVSVEELQRQIRSDRKDNNIELETKYFNKLDDGQHYALKNFEPSLEEAIDVFKVDDDEREFIKRAQPNYQGKI